MDVIVANDVTKTYRIGVGRGRVREALPWPFDRAVSRMFPRWWTRHTFCALDGLSISIPRGSSVGLVGHNGAGKTTLLRVIAGVTEPSSGSVSVSGKVAALLDMVMGFHPDLTGRENAHLLGAISGVGHKAMEARMERIIEFSGIAELLDTPLKRYSAGMVARLGFSTITSLDIDILLVDEVLAVGDVSFQRKCIKWLEDYRSRGGTLLFVSHNLSLVRSMTERVAWLDHGTLVEDGPTNQVLGAYAKALERREDARYVRDQGKARKEMVARGLHRWGAGGARVDEVHIQHLAEETGSLNVSIAYEAPDLDEAIFCLGFVDEGGRDIGAASSPRVSVNGKGMVRCVISPIPLRPGIYFPVVAILSPDGKVRDRWKLERAVVVDGESNGLLDGFGPFELSSSWQG